MPIRTNGWSWGLGLPFARLSEEPLQHCWAGGCRRYGPAETGHTLGPVLVGLRAKTDSPTLSLLIGLSQRPNCSSEDGREAGFCGSPALGPLRAGAQ